MSIKPNFEFGLKKEIGINNWFTISPSIGYTYFYLYKNKLLYSISTKSIDSISVNFKKDYNTKLHNLHQFNIGVDLGFKINNMFKVFIRYALPLNTSNPTLLTGNYTVSIPQQNYVGGSSSIQKVNYRQFGVGLYYQLKKKEKK